MTIIFQFPSSFSTKTQWMWVIMTEHSQVGESTERKESISVDELDLVSAQVSVEW